MAGIFSLDLVAKRGNLLSLRIFAILPILTVQIGFDWVCFLGGAEVGELGLITCYINTYIIFSLREIGFVLRDLCSLLRAFCAFLAGFVMVLNQN